MKILIVNTDDSSGGAAIAASRLHESLLLNNIEAKLLVVYKKSQRDYVYAIDILLRKLVIKISKYEHRFLRIIYPKKSTTRFSTSILSIRKLPKVIEEFGPDIVHLHWVQSGLLGIDEIALIKKPIVWSLHDVWPVTGGCHYNEHCTNYRQSCGSCKVLGSKKPLDLSRLVYNSKMRAYSKHGNITFVGLSRWIFELSMESPLSFKRVVNLPNPIDTNVYKPIPAERNVFLSQLKSKGNYILIGAMSLKVKRKGMRELIDALEYVENDVNLISFGESSPTVDMLSRKTEHLGYVSDANDMAMVYNIADISVVPSLEENLSNVIMESMACGIPVVAFNIGGNSDLISHKVNGYLAKPFDLGDLARGIDWTLEHKDKLNLSQKCVNKIREEFSYSIVGKQYFSLYNEILKKESNLSAHVG